MYTLRNLSWSGALGGGLEFRSDTLSIIQDLEWLGQFLNSPCDHFAYQNLNAILNGQRYQRILLSLGAWLHK